MKLGEIIKQVRNQKQMSQPQLAELAGIEQSYLSKLENNHSIPSNEIFRKLLTALNTKIEDVLTQLAADEVFQLAKQVPDIEHWLNKQKQQDAQQSRKLLLISSLLIVLSTTLFYMGFSKLAFPEWMYRYESKGLVKAGEPIDIFDTWHKDLRSREKLEQKREEMRLRYLPHFRITDYNHGQTYVRELEQGQRLYQQKQKYQQPRTVNALLQILAVLLFSAGFMGFVLENRLHRKARA